MHFGVHQRTGGVEVIMRGKTRVLRTLFSAKCLNEGEGCCEDMRWDGRCDRSGIESFVGVGGEAGAGESEHCDM